MTPTSEIRRGWPTLLAAMAGIGCGASPVPFTMIGHITAPLQAEFAWGRGEIMLAVTVLGVTATLFSPWFGGLIDKYGVRRVGTIALVGFSLSWMATTLTPGNIYAYYGLWGLMAVVGGASIPISWTRAVNAWFVRHRGLALAIALMGTGFSGIALNLAAPAVVAAVGWRGAVIGSALPALLVAAPLAFLLLRDEPPAASSHSDQNGEQSDGRGAEQGTDQVPDQDPDPSQEQRGEDAQPVVGFTLQEALGQARFWIMFVAFGMVAVAFAGLYANFVPMLIDNGFTPQAAGAVTGLVGFSILAGRLAAGALFDRFWAPLVAAPLLICPAIACLVIASGAITPVVASITAILIGLAAGVESDLIAYLAARYFGILHYGRIYGVLYMAFGAGSASSPPVYGWTYDVFGSYTPALIAGAILFAGGAMLLFLIGRYPDAARTQAED